MKKYHVFSVPLVCLYLVGLSSCSKYDDSDLRNQLQNLEGRVENLERQVQSINSSINSINSIINILQMNKYITKIENIDNGYKISLSDNTQLTLTNGQNGKDGKDGTNGKDAPIINVRSYNGSYYWTSTVNGVTSWLYDTNGNMIPASGSNGVTPLLKIDNEGYWVVSYDSGNKYNRILDSSNQPIKAKPENNQSYFESLVIVNNDLVLTLKDGTELSLPIGKISPYKAIDLGLSVKWSSSNYEANSPHQQGGLYLWGDDTNSGIIGIYDAPPLNTISGTAYDIVRKNLGSTWRIPTRAEQTELITKCKWIRTTLNGVAGMKVEGPNGNSIFLPPTGYALPKSGTLGSFQIVDPTGGYYWTGDSYSSSGSRFGYYFYYNSTSYYYNGGLNTMVGKNAIRPVKD